MVSGIFLMRVCIEFPCSRLNLMTWLWLIARMNQCGLWLRSFFMTRTKLNLMQILYGVIVSLLLEAWSCGKFCIRGYQWRKWFSMMVFSSVLSINSALQTRKFRNILFIQCPIAFKFWN